MGRYPAQCLNPVIAMKHLFFLLLLCTALPLVAAEHNILVVTGGHGFDNPNFFKIFDEMPGIRYDKAELPKDMDLLAPGLEKKYDLILSYDMNKFPTTEEQRTNFAKLIESGMPLVAMHHSVCGYDDWPLYPKMIGGKYLHKPTVIDGKEYQPAKYKHDLDMNIEVLDKEHPITKGVGNFTIHDEGYKNLYIKPGVNLLLKTDHPDATPEVAWTTRYGKGPIFAIVLGHDAKSYENPALRKLLAQGIDWAVDVATTGRNTEPAPGKQVVQSADLPANTVFRLRKGEVERKAEKSRRDALTKEQRDAEDKERRLKSFEEAKNPKPLSDTEQQTISYWLFLPNDYATKTTKRWPLLLFLHGSGERGDLIDKVKVHGPPKLLDDPAKAKDWPFITVSPQCPDGNSWSPLQLGLLLDELEKMYNIDRNRVYVTGLSMGGFGTWSLLYHFPDRFAAGVPICGGFDPAAAERFVDVPIWVFHGAKDKAVPVSMSTDLVDAIKAAGGKRIKATIYPDLDHDSWTVTYENPGLYRWLLEQKTESKTPEYRPNGKKRLILVRPGFRRLLRTP